MSESSERRAIVETWWRGSNAQSKSRASMFWRAGLWGCFHKGVHQMASNSAGGGGIMKHLIMEFGELDGKCSVCGAKTILVTTSQWETHPEEVDDQEFVEPIGEVSGHFCPECRCLTAIFLHGLSPEVERHG